MASEVTEPSTASAGNIGASREVCMRKVYCARAEHLAQLTACSCNFCSPWPPPLLDSFDRAILDLLQRDNTLPQREIAEVVHLSTPAVQRRIKRLQDSGVIAANVAVVAAAKVGRPLTIIVEVRVVSEQRERVAPFKRRVQDDPAVQQCYSITGDGDFRCCFRPRRWKSTRRSPNAVRRR
jgi:DNA-binding Lrp family transcriptional regulator